mmetsp:Transcript_22140/g.16527  ORF Transcript_22140/g.16527 Transcript_22140/m.16527 type:complete len:82 (+) Transcript_22140:225-470(+)
MIIEDIDMRSEEFTPENEGSVLQDILSLNKGAVKELQRKWEKASMMRKWLNEKKSKLSHKFSEHIKKEFEEKKEVERLKME